MSDLHHIIKEFLISGTVEKIEPFGGGHINKTYKVTTQENFEEDYLLQRINHEVFTDVEALMDNISKVTDHIAGKTDSRQQRVLSIILTKDDKLFYAEEDIFWRVFKYLRGARSYEKAENKKHAYEAARMFGEFLRDLSDFPAQELHVTIQDFHNMDVRLEQFEEALAKANPHRIEQAQKQVEIIGEYENLASDLYKSADSGDFPLRVTHNDTKFNNVLLDEEGNGYAVIDLDTVMPGYVFYDVGDGVRTGVVTAEEDEQNLELVSIDEAKYEAYIRGYLKGTENILSDKELQSIPLAGFYMAFIMGVRFLTDYLNGNIYYRVDFPNHNFYRARCQLHVAKLLKQKEKEIRTLISEVS